jgi:predicted transcriptional regulator
MQMTRKKHLIPDDLSRKLDELAARHNERPDELLRLAINAMYQSMPKSATKQTDQTAHHGK